MPKQTSVCVLVPPHGKANNQQQVRFLPLALKMNPEARADADLPTTLDCAPRNPVDPAEISAAGHRPPLTGS